ncbi:HNH endonuclease [Agathobacter rectalis]|uniref:Uncharacterized protein n=1 Tax=Agathobacter rectalis TaxID=39491 RepID=A0A3E4YLB5_9FIRM|nr:HNH endonuclease [Agathobacter rectalis]RGM75383.1 hypothetical protein DXB99_02360 [Agathobacter rectalis]
MTIKQIENFPNYYVSTEGDIYSTKKSKTLIKLKPWIDSKGKYLQIGLINSEGKRIKMLVHRIVAITFIPNHNNLPEINHKDKNTQRNCVENLEWCTRKYNLYDSYSTLSPKRNNNKCTLYKNNKKIKDFKNIKGACNFAHNTFKASSYSLEKYLMWKDLYIIVEKKQRKNKPDKLIHKTQNRNYIFLYNNGIFINRFKTYKELQKYLYDNYNILVSSSYLNYLQLKNKNYKNFKIIRETTL